jgi:hypothetical protein
VPTKKSLRRCFRFLQRLVTAHFSPLSPIDENLWLLVCKGAAKTENLSHLTPSQFTEYLRRFWREDVQEQQFSLVKASAGCEDVWTREKHKSEKSTQIICEGTPFAGKNRSLWGSNTRAFRGENYFDGRLVVAITDCASTDGYLLGSYRIATAPEPNSSRLTSFKSIRFDSPANNVGPWPGRGSRPRDDASLRPRTLHDDRSTRPM